MNTWWSRKYGLLGAVKKKKQQETGKENRSRNDKGKVKTPTKQMLKTLKMYKTEAAAI